MKNSEILAIARLVKESGKNVSARLAAILDISRQTASGKLSKLKNDGILFSSGSGRGTSYYLKDIIKTSVTYERAGLDEDRVWREQCLPVVAELKENVRSIWHHGITEMVNNAIDHSGSDQVTVTCNRNILDTECTVSDRGEGIFLKIQRAMNLYDPREAILELAKGKLTTDPVNHSGEGIFFSSKMFDRFWIESNELCFIHLGNDTPDVLLTNDLPTNGTKVLMRLNNDSSRTAKEVFDKFALPEEFSFAKTIVPVKLAQYEGETLVSRSQAKRLTRRFERFQKVILDFEDVDTIGQGFADEVFRVFAKAHPDLTMMPINMTAAVRAMIKRVQYPT